MAPVVVVLIVKANVAVELDLACSKYTERKDCEKVGCDLISIFEIPKISIAHK